MSRLFRKSFLENLRDDVDDLAFSVPDRLLPLFWPTLFTLSFALAALIAWLFIAQLVVTIKADGVVMPLGGVRSIAAVGEGFVTNSVKLSDGDLHAGDTILSISTPINSAAYEDERNSYLAEMALAKVQRQAIEKSYKGQLEELHLQLKVRGDNIARLNKILNSLEVAIAEHKKIQLSMLHEQEDMSHDIKQLYEGMQEGNEQLRADGFVSQRSYIQFQESRASALRSLAGVATQMSESKIDEQNYERQLSDIRNQIATEQSQEQQLLGDLKEAHDQLEIETQQIEVQAINGGNSLLDTERKLWAIQTIFSPYDGKIVTINKTPGQLVKQSEAVALINLVPQNRKLLLVLSPRAQKGTLTFRYQNQDATINFKKGDPEFERTLTKTLAGLSPGHNFNLRYNNNGQVVISGPETLPEAIKYLELIHGDLYDNAGVPVFSSLFAIGDNWAQEELTMIALLRASDGKRVAVGDRALVKPKFERTLIGTQVIARVKSVSNYVTTPLEAQALIGSAEIAETLAGSNAEEKVAVILSFQRDKQNNLQLNGKALSRPLTTGALATSYIEVERASPIQVLLPFYANLAQ